MLTSFACMPLTMSRPASSASTRAGTQEAAMKPPELATPMTRARAPRSAACAGVSLGKPRLTVAAGSANSPTHSSGAQSRRPNAVLANPASTVSPRKRRYGRGRRTVSTVRPTDLRTSPNRTSCSALNKGLEIGPNSQANCPRLNDGGAQGAVRQGRSAKGDDGREGRRSQTVRIGQVLDERLNRELLEFQPSAEVERSVVVNLSLVPVGGPVVRVELGILRSD